MNYDATITAVNSKTVNRKSDNKTITIYEIQDSTGKKWTTSRRDIADEAHSLINKSASITGRIEQNGTYENFYLDDLRASTGAIQRAADQQPNGQTYAPQQQQQMPVQQPHIAAEGEGTAKDWTVWRQTATKVAAVLATTPEEFWENVGQLITFYATGLQPELRSTNQPPQPPREREQVVTSYAPAQAAQQAAERFVPADVANDPGRQDSPQYDDSDIPF